MRECIVCQSGSAVEHYCHIDRQDYLRCSACGLIYIDKLLKTEEIYKAYRGSNLKSLRRRFVSFYRKLNHFPGYQEGMVRAKKIIDFVVKQVENPQDKLDYLDIGCNRGYLLAEAARRNWNPHGVEIVPELMAPFINSYPQYKNQIYSGRFEDIKDKFLHDDMFDVITGIDVVEHFEDVIKDIEGIYSLVKPGGYVILQTPDSACEHAHLEKCHWGALKPLEHLHLFTTEGLAELAKRTGFSGYQVFKAFEDADGNFVAVLKK